MRRRSGFSWYLFFWGLGSNFQIVASLSITELFSLVAAPILFSRELPYLKRNGIMPFLNLLILMVFGCALACYVNHTEFAYALRGMAVTCLLPCCVITGHWLLRRDMNGFKWMILGSAISSVACTFVFQRAVELSMYGGGASGDAAVEGIMSGPLFWIQRMGAFVTLPSKGWYLSCPTFYNLTSPLFMALFALLTSTSGRAASLCALGTVGIVAFAGKSQARMRKLGKHFFLMVIMGVVGVLVFYNAYKFSAANGLLGEAAQEKYEQQGSGGGILKLVISGRVDSFAGFPACFDRPIVGWGPWAVDEKGYGVEFLRKYGNEDDYEKAIELQNYLASKGIYGQRMIAAHSIIEQFWVWFGISGLIVCLYTLFVCIRFFIQDSWAVPQWYMWLTASIPGFLWSVFFSPFADRAGFSMVMVAWLLARVVRMGRQRLPLEMIQEILKVERK